MDNLENLRASLDDFSLKLYGVIASQSSHDNIFLSPLSISSALLLVYVGANNETKKEIEHALQLSKSFGGKREDVLAAYQEVLRVFVPGKDEDSGEASYQLALANKAYVRQDLTLKPQFEKTITTQLNSEVRTRRTLVDQSSRFQENPKRINNDRKLKRKLWSIAPIHNQSKQSCVVLESANSRTGHATDVSVCIVFDSATVVTWSYVFVCPAKTPILSWLIDCVCLDAAGRKGGLPGKH